MATIRAEDKITPEKIRALRADEPKARARDFAEQLGISEADLVAAQVGHGATAIAAHPDQVMPLVTALGDVMALTRNDSCVIERIGTYQDYRSGQIAQIVLGEEIDLRFFGKHWVHAFALDDGDKRSIQVFDAAGDAVHKIHLKPQSNVAAFDALVAALRLPEQSDQLDLAPRRPVEAAKADPARIEELRDEWARMTDTHQFLPMVSGLKMNRLGAYQVIGAPQAVRLDPEAVRLALEQLAAAQIPLMIFVGNMGCIEIHSGTVTNIVPMGPWINVMDPRLNVHLRNDHIAEVYLVEKPTRHGDVLSVEAFDAKGGLILQIFCSRKLGRVADYDAVVRGLPRLKAVEAAE